MLTFVIVLVALPCAIISALIASFKGRSSLGWFALGLFFGPLALLGIAIASKDYHVIEARQAREAAVYEQYPQAKAGIRAAQFIGVVLVIVLITSLF